VDDAAGTAWIVNLGASSYIPSLRSEISPILTSYGRSRPGPGFSLSEVRRVALGLGCFAMKWAQKAVLRPALARMHVNVYRASLGFGEVTASRSALSLQSIGAYPVSAISKWLEGGAARCLPRLHQNAKDRTRLLHILVRRCRMLGLRPAHWEEVSACEPLDFLCAHNT